MKLTAAWADRVGAGVISLAMSGVMSGLMIGLNAGLGPDFPVTWLKAWALGLVIAFPTARVIVPPVVRWQLRYRD